MNVLLINPPFIMSEDNPTSKTGAVLPPLGLLYLAAFLRKKHPQINIQLLDSPTYRLNLEDFVKKIKEFHPDVVGLTIYTTAFPSVIETTKKIKEIFPACIIIGGGPHASILPEECLTSAKIDIAVLGEGESVFSDLIECFVKGRKISSVPNIVYKKNGKILKTPIKTKNVDLDSLPFPARDLINMKLYHPAHGTFKRLPATNMITSRGCPFHCSFCSKSIFGRNYRTQSPSKTVKEIEMLIKKYGIKEILFNDDVFTSDRQRIESLCDLLIKKRVDITWVCSTRVNLVDPKLLQKMKSAGCVSVGYGIEVGDIEILKKINKGISFKRAKEAIKWTKDAGIETRAFYIFGFPDETKKSLQKTLKLALELNADFVIFNIATPFPGTSLYEEAKSKDLLLYDGLELYKRADGPHPLIRLKGVSEEELVQFYKDAYKKYYFRINYITSQIKNIKSLNDIKRYFMGFLSFLKWSN